MYLHLGRDTVVGDKNIIGIFDIEGTTLSKNTREFLKTVEEEGFVKNVSEDLPRSFIVCEIDSRSVVYITNISSVTLQKRAGKSVDE